MINFLKKILSLKQAYVGFFLTSIIVIIYNFLILAGLIDYKYAWGGRLSSHEQMYIFGTLSIIVQLLFVLIIIFNRKQTGNNRKSVLIRCLVYLIALILFLSAIGNIFAKELFEKIIFAPLAFIGSFCVLRLALGNFSGGQEKN